MNLPRAHRRPLLLISPLLALALLAGCATSPTGGSATTKANAEWSYTDDTGKTVTLDHRPERIASFTDYALGLLSTGIKPVAVFGRTPVKTDDRFTASQLKGVAIVGNSYGEIDLEALAESAPDLIVTGIYPTDRKGTLDLKGPLYAFADVEQQAQLEKIAPVVAIKVGGKGLDVITSLNKLAVALGADPAKISAAKKKYDAAAADLTKAADESKLEVTQMYADASGIYVVKPADEPETQLYGSLGVKYTDRNPSGPYYWDIYSWENAAQMMTGDVLLVNIEGYQKAELEAQSTFADDPALKAGQVYAWNGAALDYASQAAHMEKLAKILRGAEKLS